MAELNNAVEFGASGKNPCLPSAASYWPLVALILVALLNLNLALNRSINWDEFYFLSQVHDFSRGELTLPLQTLHVRFFAWLTWTDLPGVDQILLGRVVMFAALCGTCVSIFLIANRFAGVTPSMLSALAYLSVSAVMHHGWAFRTDPLATSLTMASLAILARARLTPIAILSAAVALGVAFMVTIKVILYLPVFAAMAWLRWNDDALTIKTALRLLAIPFLALGTTTIVFLLHSSGMPDTSASSETLGNSRRMMFFLGLPEKWGYTLLISLMSFPFLIAIITSIAIGCQASNLTRTEKIAIAGLFSPLLTLFYYVNTYPYYYVTMLAPVAAGVVIGLSFFVKRYGAFITAMVFGGQGLWLWTADGDSRLERQRDIQVAVDEMFQEPVNYFDFPGFLPEHKKANFFMTVWGIKNYWNAGEPAFAQTMAEKPVPLLLAVEPKFNATLLAVMTNSPEARIFHPVDVQALQETYRHIWGPIYLAGTDLKGGETKAWNVRVPGTYTVSGSITLDGNPYSNGDVIQLDRGIAKLTARDQSDGALSWGNHMEMPDRVAPPRPYWTDF